MNFKENLIKINNFINKFEIVIILIFFTIALALSFLIIYFNILAKNKSRGVYNVGSGKSFLLEDIAKYICKIFNKKFIFKKNNKTYLIGNINKLDKLGFVNNENFYRHLSYIIKNS